MFHSSSKAFEKSYQEEKKKRTNRESQMSSEIIPEYSQKLESYVPANKD